MAAVLITDVSHWQAPNVPWGNLYTDGVRAMLVQVSHGLGLDPNAGRHLDLATMTPMRTGIYHWLTPYDDPAAQARLFASCIRPTWRGRLAVDVEEDGTTWPQLDAFLVAFDDIFLTHSFPLMIYTRAAWWLANMANAPAYIVTRFDLWAAGGVGYDLQEMAPPPGYAAPIPAPWTAAVLEQFTGHGRLAGYDHELDLSISRLTEAEFLAWWDLDYLTLWRLLGANPMPIDTQALANHLVTILAETQAALRLLTPAPPPPPVNWWDTWPAGPIAPPRILPPPPAPIPMRDAAGAVRPNVTPRANAMSASARNGHLFAVYPPLDWWVAAEDLPQPAG